jgi:hypothetical protein
MDEQSFAVLIRECSDTLKAYTVEAEKTCEMLGAFKGKRLDMGERRRITAQRSAENEMHQKYMRVRERLFEAAHCGYGSGSRSRSAIREEKPE